MKDLINTVKKEDAALGIAFDGDGDRVGLISGKGEIVFPDKIMMLFAKDILDKNKGGGILVYNILNGEASPLNINNNKSISNSINDIKSDNYGNIWSDSETELFNYEWIDISEIGTLYSFPNNDDFGEELLLDFDFPFYDNLSLIHI